MTTDRSTTFIGCTGPELQSRWTRIWFGGMSLLVDPPSLVADGETYARLAPESVQGRAAGFAGAVTIGVYWAAAAAFWFDHPLVRPLRKRLGYRSGREFMLRFPLPERGRRGRRANSAEDALAVAGLATYPLWWRLGWDHGRRARARGA